MPFVSSALSHSRAFLPGLPRLGSTELAWIEPGHLERGLTTPGLMEPGLTERGLTEPGSTEPRSAEFGLTTTETATTACELLYLSHSPSSCRPSERSDERCL